MALIVSMFATMILAGLGLSLVLLGSAETTLAAHDLQASAAAHAARAALELATSELRGRPDWNGLLLAGSMPDVCDTPGALTDVSLQPRAPWDGSTIDLNVLTARVQARSDAATPVGLAQPQWRLFEFGPISRLMPPGARGQPLYVVTWVADGREATVLLHAAAFGPAGLTTALEASLARRPDGTSLVRRAVRAAP
jgi:hypothetical protein